MFWTILIIAVPALVLAGMLVRVRQTRSLREYRGKVTVWDAIGVSAGFFVGTLFLAFIVSLCYGGDKVAFEHHMPLKSIQDNSEIHGSFFLASGGFGEDMKYYYYVERDGAYRLEDKTPSRFVGVREGDKAELIEKGYSYKGNFWTWNIMGEHEYVEDTIFVVPNGTIKQDYVLDAKK